MDTSLTDEQRLLVDMFRDFAQSEAAPRAEALDQDGSAPVDALRKAGALDLLGLLLPEENGGSGAGWLAYGLLLEELGKVCLSTAVSINAHCCAVMALAAASPSPGELVEHLLSGQTIAAVATNEPEAGSDLSALATAARSEGDSYVLDGCKCDVINGDVAGVIIVIARVGGAPGAFVATADSSGLRRGWRDRQMGLRGAAGAVIYLDNCRLPASHRAADAATLLNDWQRATRLGLSFAGLGIAERGLADSVRFAIDRQQFGGPIARKQAIQGYLAEMTTRIEALRRLAYHTALLCDHGAASESDVAMLKLLAGQTATWVIDRAVQIHGGMGYMRSFHVERLYRDVRAMTILEGASENQRQSVAAGLLADAGLPASP